MTVSTKSRLDTAHENLVLNAEKFVSEKINSATMRAYVREYYDVIFDEMPIDKLMAYAKFIVERNEMDRKNAA